MAVSSTVSKALLLAAVALPAWGMEAGGVRLDDAARVANVDLELMGAGVRTRFFFDVYAIGLYVTNRSADPLAAPGPKRVYLHMLRDVGAQQFAEALADGIRANHSEAQMQALEPAMRELVAMMQKIGEAKRGMAITLDWTGAATEVRVDGRLAGPPIAGERFYDALLRIWLGAHPVQDDLKKALLGR